MCIPKIKNYKTDIPHIEVQHALLSYLLYLVVYEII